MMKNGIHFTAKALPADEPFKTVIHANQRNCDITVWTPMQIAKYGISLKTFSVKK